MSAYRIAAVARRTGLTADTIRAWERRYGMITPQRTPSGERRYSDDDVARLELVRNAIALGHSVGEVARLSNPEIEVLLETTRSSTTRPSVDEPAGRRTIAAILEATRAYDLTKAESLLSAAAMFFPPQELIVDILAPLMHDVGAGWERGELTIAQEHFATHLIRSVIGSLLRLHVPVSDETLLFLTPPDEQHELGILFAAALAAAAGIRAVVLGADVPIAEVVTAARGTGASRIVAGITYAQDLALAAAYVRELRNALPTSIGICVGGHAVARLAAGVLPEGVTIAQTLGDFDRWLGHARR